MPQPRIYPDTATKAKAHRDRRRQVEILLLRSIHTAAKKGNPVAVAVTAASVDRVLENLTTWFAGNEEK